MNFFLKCGSLIPFVHVGSCSAVSPHEGAMSMTASGGQTSFTNSRFWLGAASTGELPFRHPDLKRSSLGVSSFSTPHGLWTLRSTHHGMSWLIVTWIPGRLNDTELVFD